MPHLLFEAVDMSFVLIVALGGMHECEFQEIPVGDRYGCLCCLRLKVVPLYRALTYSWCKFLLLATARPLRAHKIRDPRRAAR